MATLIANSCLLIASQLRMALYNSIDSESESSSGGRTDDEDEIIIVLGAELLLLHPNADRYGGQTTRIPRHDDMLTGRQWVEQLITGPYRRIMWNMRITVDNFLYLCDILVRNGYVPQNYQKRVLIEEALAMTLVMVSHNHRQRVLTDRFNRSPETINRNIREVLCGLCLFASDIIRPDFQNDVHPRIARNRMFYPWFKDAVGALNGTHILACPPRGEEVAYTNRYGTHTQNILAVCDHNMRFIYVYAGWEGSAHDARVLESALTYPSDFSLPLPGKYYLVDAAYRNVPGFLPPYKNIGHEAHAKSLFNTHHSQLRNVIERAFGVLKNRFKFLKGPVPNFYMSTQISVVIACCALHNFLRIRQPGDAHFRRYEEEDMQLHHEPIVPPITQVQPLNVSQAEVEAWKTRRDLIANEMYAAQGRRRC